MLGVARVEGGREGETEKRHWNVLVPRIGSQSCILHTPFNRSSFARPPSVTGGIFLCTVYTGLCCHTSSWELYLLLLATGCHTPLPQSIFSLAYG